MRSQSVPKRIDHQRPALPQKTKTNVIRKRKRGKEKECGTDLASKFSDIKRDQLSPRLVTMPDVFERFGRVLAGFFDEDFVTAWVLRVWNEGEGGERC
jgi:hypothetical protein